MYDDGATMHIELGDLSGKPFFILFEPLFRAVMKYKKIGLVRVDFIEKRERITAINCLDNSVNNVICGDDIINDAFDKIECSAKLLRL